MKKLRFISCNIDLLAINHYISSNIGDLLSHVLRLEMNLIKVTLENCYESA